MALNIVTSAQPLHIDHLITFIYGDPGVWKTSLAFTAKNPILFDFDKGSHRADNRKDTVQIKAWHEVSKFTKEDLQGYDTIIIDTVGRVLDMITDSMRISHSNKFQTDGSLSLKGYGTLNSIFTTWLKMLKGLDKDLVLLAHMDEKTVNDVTNKRPDIAGSSKKELYKIADLMGCMFITDVTTDGKTVSERVIDFRPSNAFLAKDSGQIGYRVIKPVKEYPTQLADIIQATKDHINTLSAEQAQVMQDLETIQAELMEIEDIAQLNEHKNGVGSKYPNHPLLNDMWNITCNRANELGGYFNPETGMFELKQVAENA